MICIGSNEQLSTHQLNSIFVRRLMAGVHPKYPLITGEAGTLNLIVRQEMP